MDVCVWEHVVDFSFTLITLLWSEWNEADDKREMKDKDKTLMRERVWQFGREAVCAVSCQVVVDLQILLFNIRVWLSEGTMMSQRLDVSTSSWTHRLSNTL